MTIKQQGGIFGRNPSFNEATANEFIGDLSGQNVSLNKSGGGLLTLSEPSNSLGDGSKIGSVNFYSNDPSGTGVGTKASIYAKSENSSGSAYSLVFTSSYWLDSEVDYLTITGQGDVKVNEGNLVIGTSGQGIDFSATSGTGTSELFDDYEEGTWTPVPSSGSVTVTNATYVKIGKKVFLEFYVTATSDCSGSFTGLPFTPDSAGAGGVVSYHNQSAEVFSVYVLTTAFSFRTGSSLKALSNTKTARGVFSYTTA